jgi:hypothetical protein
MHVVVSAAVAAATSAAATTSAATAIAAAAATSAASSVAACGTAAVAAVVAAAAAAAAVAAVAAAATSAEGDTGPSAATAAVVVSAVVASVAAASAAAPKELQGRDHIALSRVAEVGRRGEVDCGDHTPPRGWQEREKGAELSVTGVGSERRSEIPKPQDAPGRRHTGRGVCGSEALVGSRMGDGGVVDEGLEKDFLRAHVLRGRGAMRGGAAHGTEVVCVALGEGMAV